MSLLYGANRTHANSPTPAGSHITDPGTLAGKVMCMVDTYTMLGTEAALDTLQMGKAVPKGAYILEQILSCNASVGATATVDVGDAEDADRYMAGVDLASAAINRIDEPDTGAGYKVDETDADNLDNQALITFATLVTPVTGTIITLITLYTID